MDKWDLPAFKFKLIPPNEIRDEWVRYKRQFEYLALANGVTNKTRLKHIFLARAGPDVQDVFSSIPGADIAERIGVDPFKVAMDKLDEYFAPKQHEAYQRFVFWSLTPKDKEEPLDKFLLRAMEYAGKCNFGNTKQEAQEIGIIDKIIQHAPPDLREKLLQKEKLVLDEVIKMVNSYGTIKYQANQMAGSSRPQAQPPLDAVNKIINLPSRRGQEYECSRCGRRGHSGSDRSCPARTKVCDKCGKIGHFAKVCHSTHAAPKRENHHGTESRRKRIKYNQVRAIENSENEGNFYSFIFAVGDGDEFLWVKIGGVLIQVLIDSGCQKNIIDDTTWQKMRIQGAEVQNLRSYSTQTFRAYGNNSEPLVVENVFESRIEVEDGERLISTTTTFYVIKGGSQALLGRSTAKDLGVLVLGLPSTNSSDVFRVRSEHKHPFPKIKGIKLTIPIDETIAPISQHARRPPLALLDKIEEKLDSLLAADIIEPISEFSEWVSPLVTIVKDNGDLRLCVDMRRANMAIKRETHMMPTFEDFLPRLKKARFFSRLDIKEAFHQVELNEQCRHITTFITHRGMFRYKRLMFGISCAPEMFQKILEQILSICENVVNYIDDCLIFGETLEEHDHALGKVMQTLQSKNILLNHEKCVFRVEEIEFLGHHLSAKGIRPTDDKLEALKSFRAPQSSEELRSFLGLVTYVGKFLPDLATVCAPLRVLTHSGVTFTWQHEHEEAFRELKSMISDIRTLHFFDNTLRTRVIADASPVGLGAVLVQFTSNHDDSNPRVICYASKSLSPTEKRYCQTEKEALALVWAVERFSTYLLGRKFELETDHKPLEIIFSPTSRPCARIERWVLRLQAFTFVVKYRKGSGNVADPFSRLAVECNSQDFDCDSQFLVLAIMESAAIDTSELEKASVNDHELSIVRECLRSGKWDKIEGKPFEVFQNELGFVGDLLVRGSKLVVPKLLRNRMLVLAHEGHPGETVMKRRLRDRVWWPKMDREVETYVTACEGCRLVGLPSKPEPMQRRELPIRPWIDVALDFLGPLPSGDYLLVVIDYYSRYKEIEIMRQITAEETIARLHKIFTRLGFPVTLTLDNARQFISSSFENYCQRNGIHLNYSTPYWPQENGLVERQNRSLLKRLQISHALGRDWKSDLQEYLLMYYTSPHSVTGKTPTELCFGRTIRSKIPSLTDVEVAPSRDEVAEKDHSLKTKGKEREDQKRHARRSELMVGDTVLMKNLLPGNKLTTTFNPNECVVVDKRGSRVTVKNKESDKVYRRNVAHLKRITDHHEVADRCEDTAASFEHQERDSLEPSPSTLRTDRASVEDLEENFELEPASSKADKRQKKRKNKEAEVGAFVKRPKQSAEEENGQPEDDGDAEASGQEEEQDVSPVGAYEILLGNQEFESLRGKVSDNTLKAVAEMGFTKMTEIQAKAIPALLEGRDLIGSAKTGSGKTLAFLLPAVELIYKLQFKPRNGTGVIIISPTRELTMQIFGVLKELMAHQHHTYGLLMGGASRHTENEKLGKGLNIVVATPGRLLDHLKGTPNFLFKNLQCLIIDECDRILEIGFEEDLKQIISILPKKRQTMLFSATQTSRIDELGKLALKSEPIYVGVDDHKTEATVSGLEQGYIVCPSEKRLLMLFTFLKKNRRKKVMVFFSSCLSVKYHHELFNYIDLPVNSIHGKQKQAKRTSVFFQFCNAESGILLCTDVAARGLDIPAVDWIVQYDPPNDTKEYIHRVGRTARSENICGHALMLLRPEEVAFLKYLKQAKVPLNEFEFSWSKIADIQLQLENLLSKNYFLNQSGKLAFKSYVRAYEGHHMKDVFNVGTLDLVDFGKSYKIQNSDRRAGNRGLGHFKTLNKDKKGEMKFKHIKNRKELKKIEYQ